MEVVVFTFHKTFRVNLDGEKISLILLLFGLVVKNNYVWVSS
jgi:hypothetical protein